MINQNWTIQWVVSLNSVFHWNFLRAVVYLAVLLHLEANNEKKQAQTLNSAYSGWGVAELFGLPSEERVGIPAD